MVETGRRGVIDDVAGDSGNVERLKSELRQLDKELKECTNRNSYDAFNVEHKTLYEQLLATTEDAEASRDEETKCDVNPPSRRAVT